MQIEAIIDMLQLKVMKPSRESCGFMALFVAFVDREKSSYDGRPMLSVKLIISEVNSEDLEQPFVCQASNTFGQVASYIILKHRGKKYCCFSDLCLT